jgi:hypothetical protein
MNDRDEANHATDEVPSEASNAGAGRPVTSDLHRAIYAIVVGLAIWLVLSVWLFAANGPTDYLLFVVSGFISVVVSLLLILSRVGRRTAKARTGRPRWRDWAHSDFEIGQGGGRSLLQGTQAATQILLPLVAVAFGMTLFGVVLLVVEHISA